MFSGLTYFEFHFCKFLLKISLTYHIKFCIYSYSFYSSLAFRCYELMIWCVFLTKHNHFPKKSSCIFFVAFVALCIIDMHAMWWKDCLYIIPSVVHARFISSDVENKSLWIECLYQQQSVDQNMYFFFIF